MWRHCKHSSAYLTIKTCVLINFDSKVRKVLTVSNAGNLKGVLSSCQVIAFPFLCPPCCPFHSLLCPRVFHFSQPLSLHLAVNFDTCLIYTSLFSHRTWAHMDGLSIILHPLLLRSTANQKWSGWDVDMMCQSHKWRPCEEAREFELDVPHAECVFWTTVQGLNKLTEVVNLLQTQLHTPNASVARSERPTCCFIYVLRGQRTRRMHPPMCAMTFADR